MRRLTAIAVTLSLWGWTAVSAHAAVGCTLSNPAQDLKSLYPGMTTYKEAVYEMQAMPDGRQLFDALKARLGSDLDPVYETFETPYVVYSIYEGEKLIGIVHGVTVPGEAGVIQIFISADSATGTVSMVFYQRMESPVSRYLKKREFLRQFNGLTLADFYKHDYLSVSGDESVTDKVGLVTNPLPDSLGISDYNATIRGVRKNLILLDFFVYGRRNEPFFEKSRELLAGTGSRSTKRSPSKRKDSEK